MSKPVVEFVEVDGINLRVATQRGVPGSLPLLLFNGIGANLELCFPFMEAMPEREIVIFDVPGVGRSEMSWRPRRFSGLARLANKLLDRQGYQQVDVIGVSWGGALAQQFARQYPQRIRGLLLSATFCEPETDEGKRRRNDMADRLLREGMHPYAEEVLPKMLAARSIATLPAVAAHVTAMMQATDPEGAAAALRGRAERPPYESTLASLTVPTLVVVGSEDAFTTREQAEHMRDLVQGSELVWLAGIGHMPNLESPALFNATLIRWLERCASKRTSVRT